MDYQSSSWEHLRKTIAEEFTRYNIYCGNRVYTNKYERDERGFPLRFHPVDLSERREVVRGAGERLAREWAERDRLIREYMPVAQALREKHRKQAG